MSSEKLIFIMKSNPTCLGNELNVKYGEEYIVDDKSNVVLLPVNNSDMAGRVAMPIDQLYLNGICTVMHDLPMADN